MKNDEKTAEQMTITSILNEEGSSNAPQVKRPKSTRASKTKDKMPVTYSKTQVTMTQVSERNETDQSIELVQESLKLTNREISSDNLSQTTLDFETAIAELERVVNELDREVKLERALLLFEQGMKLSMECEKFLKAAEQKVEILKRTADGGIAIEPFQPAVTETAED